MSVWQYDMPGVHELALVLFVCGVVAGMGVGFVCGIVVAGWERSS